MLWVAVLLSGRPLWQNREINLANAYVAAWLPGTEGGAIAPVLTCLPIQMVLAMGAGTVFVDHTTASAVPKKVNVGTSTSSPGPTSADEVSPSVILAFASTRRRRKCRSLTIRAVRAL